MVLTCEEMISVIHSVFHEFFSSGNKLRLVFIFSLGLIQGSLLAISDFSVSLELTQKYGQMRSSFSLSLVIKLVNNFNLLSLYDLMNKSNKN